MLTKKDLLDITSEHDKRITALEKAFDIETNRAHRFPSDDIFALLWSGDSNLTLNGRIEKLNKRLDMLEEYLEIVEKTTPAKPETKKYVKKKK